MRYTDKKPVDQVLAWLAERGVPSGRQTFQTFLRRMLNLMSDAKANQIGVDLELLRAVRRRLQLPISPAPGRVRPLKAMLAFNSRSRRRRVNVAKKIKRPPPVPPTHPSRQEKHEFAQLPRPGLDALPEIEAPYAKLRGTPDKPSGFGDYRIINEVARAKLAKINRWVWPNQQGDTINIRTRHEYTAEELVEQFGLSPTEAQTCFMSFDGPER